MKHKRANILGFVAWFPPALWLGLSSPLWAAEPDTPGGTPTFSWWYGLARYWPAPGLAVLTSLIALILLVLLAIRYQQLRAKERHHAESELRFRQIADNSNLVFWVRNRDEVLYISKAYETIWGRSRDSLYQDPAAFTVAVHPDDRARVAQALQRELTEPGSFDEEYRVVRPDDTIRWVHARSFPVRDASGRVDRWTGVAEDITESKAAAFRIAQQAQERDQLLSALGEGVFGVDRDGRCTFINPAALAMLGYHEADVLDHDPHALFHHSRQGSLAYKPGDCPILRTLRDGHTRHQEDWFFMKDGSRFPVELTVAPILLDGVLDGAVASFRNISERRSAQARDRLLVSALKAAANAVVITDRNAVVEWVNPAFEALTGYSLEESLGKRPAELLQSGCQDKPFYTDMWHTILTGETWRGEIVNKKKDGTLYHEELIIDPVKDEAGAIRHFIGIKQDISMRKRMEAELQTLATTDPLTGLPNRRHFLAQLDKEVARLRRFEQQTAALLMLDLDHFKAVNDRYGHATGDKALKHFAGVMNSCLRKVDLAGRLGGEEFAVLLLGSDSENALEFADRLRVQVSRSPLETEHGQVHISVSIGVTQLQAGDPDIGNMAEIALAQADRALYRAKSQGRNRVELSTPALTEIG